MELESLWITQNWADKENIDPTTGMLSPPNYNITKKKNIRRPLADITKFLDKKQREDEEFTSSNRVFNAPKIAKKIVKPKCNKAIMTVQKMAALKAYR